MYIYIYIYIIVYILNYTYIYIYVAIYIYLYSYIYIYIYIYIQTPIIAIFNYIMSLISQLTLDTRDKGPRSLLDVFFYTAWLLLINPCTAGYCALADEWPTSEAKSHMGPGLDNPNLMIYLLCDT